RASRHPKRRERQDGRARVIREYAGVACRPARAELRSVEEWRDHDRRAHRTENVGHVGALGKVLAHRGGKPRAFAELDELDRPAGNVDRFPPADMGVQRAAQVVLVNLRFIERPTMVLPLTDMHPMLAGQYTDVHPVTRELPSLLRTLTDPGDETRHPVIGEKALEPVDLAVVHGALRQNDDIDGVDLVPGGDERSIHEVQIEPFGGYELEEAERFLA